LSSVTSQRKILIENISSMLFLQGINYILPLVTLPYLTRTLGIEKFGLISFAIIFIQYFTTIVDYGFNLTATRQISVYRDNPKKVSEIFSSVIVIKVFLLVLCFLLMNSIILSVDKFHDDLILYHVCFIAVLGNVLFPIWFYQGLEHLKKIALINAITKISITALIFIFVKQQHDYLVAAFLQCLAVVIAGVIAIIYVPFTYPVKIIIPKIQVIKQLLLEGFPVFISVISSNIFGNSNIFILGILYSNKEVGYFTIAQKIVWAFCYLVPPIGNAIYPRMGLMFKESNERAIKALRKLLLYGSGAFIIISSAIYLFSGFFVKIATGRSENDIVILIKVMAILPLCFFIDNVLGTQIMLNRGMDKKYMTTYIIGGLVSVLLAIILIPQFSHFGASINQLISEVFIICLMYYFVQKEKINILSVNHFNVNFTVI